MVRYSKWQIYVQSLQYVHIPKQTEHQLSSGTKRHQSCLEVCLLVYLPVCEMLGGPRGPVPQVLLIYNTQSISLFQNHSFFRMLLVELCHSKEEKDQSWSILQIQDRMLSSCIITMIEQVRNSSRIAPPPNVHLNRGRGPMYLRLGPVIGLIISAWGMQLWLFGIFGLVCRLCLGGLGFGVVGWFGVSIQPNLKCRVYLFIILDQVCPTYCTRAFF